MMGCFRRLAVKCPSVTNACSSVWQTITDCCNREAIGNCCGSISQTIGACLKPVKEFAKSIYNHQRFRPVRHYTALGLEMIHKGTQPAGQWFVIWYNMGVIAVDIISNSIGVYSYYGTSFGLSILGVSLELLRRNVMWYAGKTFATGLTFTGNSIMFFGGGSRVVTIGSTFIGALTNQPVLIAVLAVGSVLISVAITKYGLPDYQYSAHIIKRSLKKYFKPTDISSRRLSHATARVVDDVVQKFNRPRIEIVEYFSAQRIHDSIARYRVNYILSHLRFEYLYKIVFYGLKQAGVAGIFHYLLSFPVKPLRDNPVSLGIWVTTGLLTGLTVGAINEFDIKREHIHLTFKLIFFEDGIFVAGVIGAIPLGILAMKRGTFVSDNVDENYNYPGQSVYLIWNIVCALAVAYKRYRDNLSTEQWLKKYLHEKTRNASAVPLDELKSTGPEGPPSETDRGDGLSSTVSGPARQESAFSISSTSNGVNRTSVVPAFSNANGEMNGKPSVSAVPISAVEMSYNRFDAEFQHQMDEMLGPIVKSGATVVVEHWERGLDGKPSAVNSDFFTLADAGADPEQLAEALQAIGPPVHKLPLPPLPPSPLATLTQDAKIDTRQHQASVSLDISDTAGAIVDPTQLSPRSKQRFYSERTTKGHVLFDQRETNAVPSASEQDSELHKSATVVGMSFVASDSA